MTTINISIFVLSIEVGWPFKYFRVSYVTAKPVRKFLVIIIDNLFFEGKAKLFRHTYEYAEFK